MTDDGFARWSNDMGSSRDSDRRLLGALWGHGCIVVAVCVLAALISFPSGW
jgi:hypothetical protein